MQKSHTRDNNRKCLFWVSYCVITLHALYMICNTKGITSFEDMKKKMKKGDTNSTLKMCTPLSVVLVIPSYPEIPTYDWIRHALDSHDVLFVASVMLIYVLIKWDEICRFFTENFSVRCPPSILSCSRKRNAVQSSHLRRENQEEGMTMDNPHRVLYLAPPFSLQQCLTSVNCLFCIPLADDFVLVVVCRICFPEK